MPSRVLFAVALLITAVAAPASAQQDLRAGPASSRDTTLARSATDSAVKDIERAVSALAVSLQQVLAETANKPEVRLAAVQVAGRAVGLAQQALLENTGEIERLLAEASRLLAKAEQAQRARTPASSKP